MRVVVIGGGFAGLTAVRKLNDAGVDITLIDRRNFHLFQPLLYQVATGALSPANIATPLRTILRKQQNVRVLLDEVAGVDPENKRIKLTDGEMEYDVLVVATGSRHHYFGNDQWEEKAPGLKTIEDALNIRARLLQAFEMAERAPTLEDVQSWLTFVIVGAGPTGMELAGALAEIAQHTLERDFRTIQTSKARIILVEAMDRVLPMYDPSLSRKAHEALRRLGVEVVTGAMVTGVDAGGVELKRGDSVERLDSKTVLWGAGVKAASFGERLKQDTGAETDRGGRFKVAPDLSLPNHPDILVIGDLAYYEQKGSPLPAVAAVAIQQGEYAAQVIKDRPAGRQTKPFRYKDRGQMATIGRSAAVADLGLIKLSGFIGWLAWLGVHLVMLTQPENRLLVFVQWVWNYLTRSRSALLITGPIERPPPRTSDPDSET